MTSFLDRIALHGSRRNGADAVVTDALTLDYHGLHCAVLRMREHLRALGVRASDVVGLAVEDELAHLVASLGLLDLGAAHFTLASHDGVDVQAELCAHVGMTRRIDAIDLPELSASCGADGRADAATAPAGPSGGRHGRLYLKTSGTTGGINVVPFLEEQIGLQAERHPDYRSERLLRLASIEHNNSKRHRLYCVWMGGTNVFRPRAGRFDLLKFVSQQAVTCLDISRIHAADIAALEGAERLAAVRIRTGGAAIPWSLRKALIERVSPNLCVRYAATECGAIAMAGPGEHDARECAGRPLPGVELQVVDPAGRELPRGERGLIRLRAPGIATGYLASPEQSAKRFVNGWFVPGDIGTVDADGRLYVLGRADDMLNLNGVNIFPAEIERVLESHPDVAAAVALGKPSRVHGHIPLAAVELRPGARVDEEALLAFAKRHLSLKSPRRILVLDRLPRNPQGKLVRVGMLELFTSG